MIAEAEPGLKLYPQLYTVAIEEVAADHAEEWQLRHPNSTLANYTDRAGEKHYYGLRQAEVRYIPENSPDKLPPHVMVMKDINLGRKVIAKKQDVGRDATPGMSNLIHEGHLAGVDSHPYIASIHDVAVTANGKELYLIMEYLPGGNLEQWLQEEHTLREMMSVIEKIGDALDHIHTKRKQVHADVKPRNISFDENGNAKLIDFELAGFADGKPYQGKKAASLNFASPEQMKYLMGQVDTLTYKTDIYSFAAVIFQMLSGLPTSLEARFQREDLVFNRHLHMTFKEEFRQRLTKDQQREIERVLRKALSEKPEQRYDSVKEFTTELLAALQPLPRVTLAQSLLGTLRKSLQRSSQR